VGPFFHLRLGGRGQEALVAPGTPGAIRIEGRVLDGQGEPVPDALIELWQADAAGRYCHPRDLWPPTRGGFTGFGRATTDGGGAYAFETLKPGRVHDGGDPPTAALPGPAGPHAQAAPHVSLVVFARGLLAHLHTRVYFDDEAEDNARDPVLALVPPERRRTLIAAHISPVAYRHDLVLQGAGETVFFDL